MYFLKVSCVYFIYCRSNPDQHDECLILVGDNEVCRMYTCLILLMFLLQGTVTIIRTSNIKEAFK